jgi:tRNA G18 (ribose-2'-O)-methylase SpoU
MVLANRPDQVLPSDAGYRVAECGLEHLDLCRAPLRAALFELRAAYRVIATALGRRAVPDKLESGPPVALVFGNEETGLDHATHRSL